ncbi:MAG: hypothetical protein H6R26_834 [Proteobacteria bacterium]|nr:hypothetical protein [Pseudomonadota bacterium]
MRPQTQRPRPVSQPGKAHYLIRRPHFNTPPSPEKIELALAVIPADDRDTWWRVGAVVKAELGDGGFDLWDRWSQQADSYRMRDAHDVWKSIKPGAISIGTLFYLATEYGWRPDTEMSAPSPAEIEARRQRQRADRLKGEADLTRRHQAAAARAQLIWNRSVPCVGHP